GGRILETSMSACLGTIADLVPLRGENRVIASLGLAELERTRSPGLRALIDVSRIRPPYGADDVGYRLGPRLNAPGRLESADTALELLLTRDVARAKELARDLDARNRERQEWERQAAEEARELFLARPQLPPILLGWSEGWHRGVVGIAAGRLARELNRPVLLLAVEGDRATGSGRSISGIHLHDFLSEHKDSMERFGGHAQAVGLTVAAETLPAFREALEKAAEPWAERVATRRYEYEIEIEAREAGHDLLGELRRLKPFGQGNPRPLVRVRGPLRLAAAPRLFGRGHLSAELVAPDRGRIKVLGWGWAERSSDLLGEVELLGRLELDRYTGDCVLKLVDARASVDDRPATT
ncbi:MAG: DHHA1 domain-containing protein, partial [Acidobacteriota bacterium]